MEQQWNMNTMCENLTYTVATTNPQGVMGKKGSLQYTSKSAISVSPFVIMPKAITILTCVMSMGNFHHTSVPLARAARWTNVARFLSREICARARGFDCFLCFRFEISLEKILSNLSYRRADEWDWMMLRGLQGITWWSRMGLGRCIAGALFPFRYRAVLWNLNGGAFFSW